MSDDLVDFLRARYDEEAELAQAADGDQIEATDSLWGTKYLTLRGDHDDRHTTELPAALANHIARHDPARVLAEVEAKREMLREADSFCAEYYADMDDDSSAYQRAACWRETNARLLALPYANHPDYRDEWRPS